MSRLLRASGRWGGLLAVFGGLIWAILFYLEATKLEFSLRNLMLNQPTFGLLLFLSVAFQAAGYYSLSVASEDYPIPHTSANASALGALAQSLAILAVSILGFGTAWLLGILGEMIIAIALGSFAISSFSTKLPLTIKLFPFLIVPLYFIGWSIDPGTLSNASSDYINLSAAAYGILWLPFGIAIWNYRRFPAD